MQTFGFISWDVVAGLRITVNSLTGEYVVMPQETGIIEDAPKKEVLRPDCDLPPVSVADGYRAFDLIGPLVESMSFGKG